MVKKFKKCILHIGSGKTGTSSIQRCFFSHRVDLEKNGYFYPSNTGRHYFLENFVSLNPERKPFYKVGWDSKEKIEKHLARQMLLFENDIKKSRAHTIILSNETFHRMGIDDIKRLEIFLDSYVEEFVVYCYVREPVAQATSLMQQVVKTNGAVLNAQSRAHYFNPTKSLSKYVSIFGRENIHVCEFARTKLYHEDVVADFAHRIGMPTTLINFLENETPKDINVAISHEGMLIASALNKQLPPAVNKKRNTLRAKKINLSSIAGNKYVLPYDRYQLVKARSEIDKDYLSEVFDFTFSEVAPKHNEDKSKLWSEETIDSLALYINKLLKKNEELEASIKSANTIIESLPKSDDINTAKDTNVESKKSNAYVYTVARNHFELILNDSVDNFYAFDGLMKLYKHKEDQLAIDALIKKMSAALTKQYKKQFVFINHLIKFEETDAACLLLKTIHGESWFYKRRAARKLTDLSKV